MKLSDCNTTDDIYTYVGDSTSWKVALKASKKKWEEKIGYPGNHCGFCHIKNNLCLDCGDCPVQRLCKSIEGGIFYLDRDRNRVLKAFNSSKLKTLIANSKPGQIFTDEEKI